MADYSIWVLEYSFVTKYHKSGVLYGAHNQGYVKLPYCYALIKGKNHVAMVDVGYNNKEYGKALGGPDGSEAPYYYVAELAFDDAEVLQAALASPEGQATGADVANFASGGVTMFAVQA